MIDKLRLFLNHPGFIEAPTERTRRRVQQIPEERRGEAQILYTAHSIPVAMAATCRYEQQLAETCRLSYRTAGAGDAAGWSIRAGAGRRASPGWSRTCATRFAICIERAACGTW